MLFRRRRDRLRYCPSCRSGLACPTEQTEQDKMHTRIDLRCGECGHRWSSIVNHARAQLLHCELDRDTATMWRSIEQLDLERMAIDAETFAAALARDLIEPADFAV